MKKFQFTFIFILFIYGLNGQIIEPYFIRNLNISVKPVRNINTETSEISPVFINNKLFYSSIPAANFVEWRLKRNIAYYETYDAGFIPGPNDMVTPSLIIEGEKNYNVGPVAWCEKTQELYVSLTNEIDLEAVSKLSREADSRLKLVIMKQTSGKWKITEELAFNDDEYNYAHPAISVTGDTLVFISDMNVDNIGQTDLYMSVRKNGKWSFPENLGPKINTIGQEMFPNFLPGGLLTFSSNGQLINYGNLDIYYTTFPKIEKVRNIGGRLNSQHDDFGLILEPNGNFGFFASNRPGKGSDDIFRFDIETGLLAKNVKKTGDSTTLLANVEPIRKDSANVPNSRILNDSKELADNTNPVSDISKTEIKIPAETIVKVEEKPKTVIPEKTIQTPDQKTEIALKEKSDPVKKEIKPTEIIEPIKEEVKSNALSDKNDIQSEEKYFELVIKDAVSKKPINGVSVLINNISWKTDNNGKVAIPENEMYNSILNISKPGYQNYIYAADATKPENNKLTDLIYLNSEVIDNSTALNTIYYDFDKWNIKPEAKVVLDKLVSLMNNNNELKVELNSHADSRGSHTYNMILTEKRSNSAMGYFSQKGISNQRLIAKNFGETQPVNECSDGVKCTEAQHALNRRTDLRLMNGLSLPELIYDSENNKPIDSRPLYYTVQILALQKVPSLLPEKYKQDGKVERKQIGSLAKFFIGEYDSYQLAASQKNSMKNLFKDAFVVAIRDGQVVQICDLKESIKTDNAVVLK